MTTTKKPRRAELDAAMAAYATARDNLRTTSKALDDAIYGHGFSSPEVTAARVGHRAVIEVMLTTQAALLDVVWRRHRATAVP